MSVYIGNTKLKNVAVGDIVPARGYYQGALVIDNCVIWNQLFDRTGVNISKSGASMKLVDDVVTIQKTASTGVRGVGFDCTPNHKILVSTDFISLASSTAQFYTIVSSNGYVGTRGGTLEFQISSTSGWQNISKIWTPSATYKSFSIRYGTGLPSGTQYQLKNTIVTDLTQMFGAGNEPTTMSDPKIEWILNFAKLHPDYNLGQPVVYR